MSEYVEVKIRLPKKLLNIIPPNELEQELRRLVALELYREKKISLGLAKEVAGMTYHDFMKLMKERNVYLNYGVDEFREDLKVIEELLRSHR